MKPAKRGPARLVFVSSAVRWSGRRRAGGCAVMVAAWAVAMALTISISTAERWSQWAKRDWAAYVDQRATDDAEDIDSRKPAQQTR